MAAEKYYITNNIHFIQGYGNLVSTPASATRFNIRDAKKYISLHPDHMLMSDPRSKKQKAFIISTNQKYLSGCGGIVSTMERAMTFNSSHDAWEYVDCHPELSTMLKDDAYVINSHYKHMKRTAKVKPQTVVEDTNARRIFSPVERHQVFGNSKVCALCGKPIDETDFTVDHIIPLSRGGTNDPENLRPVHKSCNHFKGNYLDKEMFDNITDIVCVNLFNSPTSELGAKMIRAMVRGTIKKYGSGKSNGDCKK